MDNMSIPYFGLKAVVKGDFILEEPIKAYNNGFEISLFIEDGVYKISIIKKISKNSPLSLKYNEANQGADIIVPDESNYRDYKIGRASCRERV